MTLSRVYDGSIFCFFFCCYVVFFFFCLYVFFFNDTATTEIYTLSLHDALPILLNLSANHERYHSNSYGYEYRKQYLTILVAKNFYGFLIRGVGEWQKKKYLDELLPAWPLELDTEREQSNFLVLDLSRDVTSSLTCVIRFAWYENESPWASFYYNKRLVNAGVEFRLPVK